MEYFLINQNVRIPAIGMGTGWMNTSYKYPSYFAKRILGEIKKRVEGTYSNENNYTVLYELRKLKNFERSVRDSRKIGYSLYDTAYSYNNCEKMGRVFGFPKNREEVVIISKCANSAQRLGKVREEFENTLTALGTDYIDLYLIHWPQTGKYIETWKILEEYYAVGKIKAIGVSNFNIHHIEEIQNKCSIVPMVNEVECHPLLQQKELRSFCKKNGILLIAHTSTGKMRSSITESVLKNMASRHEKSVAQVILRWHYQMGDVSICNTLNPVHMAENLNIFDFELSEKELADISKMDCGIRIWPDPDNCDFTKMA